MILHKQKLCLGMSAGFGIPLEEQPALLARLGFEEVFIDASGRKADIKKLAELAKEAGVGVQSVHAPFNKSDDMWDEIGELGEIAVNELLEYAEKCADAQVPIMVTHAFLGFDTDRKPTAAGVERYGRVARRCGELGIRLALENTEGLEFLDRLMNEFSGMDSVGFCWDSGHELCYNYGEDLLAKYGNKLICTHLNDNLGIRSFDGEITFFDDLHLLPFDGIRDWNEAAKRLNACSFEGTLTFELKKDFRPHRTENNIYAYMTPEDYLTEAYKRACRVGAMKLNNN